MNEKWRDVKGYKGLYQVSDKGRVRRILDNSWRSIPLTNPYKILKQPTVRGYKHAHLCKNGGAKIFKVHRLVVTAFIGKIEKGLQVNHKNGIKSDNCIENLEKSSRKENIQHRINVLGIHISFKLRKLNDEQVFKVKAMSASGIAGTVIARNFNVTSGVIYGIIHGRQYKVPQKTHHRVPCPPTGESAK